MTENTVAKTEETNGTAVATPQEDTFERERFVSPAVDIYETQEGLTVVGDLPGLKSEDITINVDKSVLTIKGIRREVADGADYLLREFTPVGYYRQFQLGSTIDQGRIDAEYRHGVLRLKLPFAEAAKPKQIAVRVG